jgi:hypothetical protein
METRKRITTDNHQKKYNKDKTIGLFIFNYKNGKSNCIEIVRGRIGSKGDIYIFPHPQSQSEFPFHESFHTKKGERSSRFHWVEKGLPKNPPAFGTKDLPEALKFSTFRTRTPPCFCFRRGKRLKKFEIKTLVENLIRFVPPTDINRVISALEKEGIYQARLGFFNDFIKSIT